jgi:hypothetical protein
MPVVVVVVVVVAVAVEVAVAAVGTCNTVRLEKLTVLQLLKKISFYGTPRFSTLFTETATCPYLFRSLL